MIRTILILLGLIASVLWLPLWVQLVVLCVAVVITPYRLTLFIPAALADVLYAPHPSFFYCKMTLLVAVLLLLRFIIMTRTRIGQRYA